MRENIDVLPFLSVELDGNVFSQIEEARFETFLLQANRQVEEMQKLRNGRNGNNGAWEIRNDPTPCFSYASMTWPPVTGRAWPVSYCCSTR